MRRFEGSNVVVTGASRGLGRSVALAFAAEGARVGIGYHSREDEARETLGGVDAAGGTAVLMQLDVRERTSVDQAFQRFLDSSPTPTLDVLVNCAATLRDNLAPLMSSDEWSDAIAVNLTGTFNCCRAALRPMITARKGAIVNIGSVAGVRASPGQANYSATKGGIVSMTATLAVEMAPRGIRINAVVPGLLTTGMGARLDRRIAAARKDGVPLGRFGEGAEVARVVVFLASDEASYVVGQSIVVDGGLSL